MKRFTQRWLMLALVAAPLFVVSLRSREPLLTWWTTNALEKVRPYAKPPKELPESVRISAARNEFEPFQIVLRADRADMKGLDIEVSDLLGPKGAIRAKDITVYFERFINLKRRSSIDGQSGEWPDALIPRVDHYYGQKRAAFPFDLSEGRNQPIWIEVFVPPATPAGHYHGSVWVLIGGKRQFAIPVELEVWNFTLPSTSSLPNSFGINGITALHQHFGRYTNDDDLFRLSYLYRKAALWHRISVHGGSGNPPPYVVEGDRAHLDWSQYDEEVAPFLNGTVFKKSEPLYGARATSIELRTHAGLQTDRERILYWREFTDHFRKRNWADRLFYYVWDEPKPKHYTEVVRLSRLAHEADPDLKTLVTSPLKRDWLKEIDIWTPAINCFFSRPGFDEYCPEMIDRAKYNPELSSGGRLWWYQACSSHGCYIDGGEYFRGWPSYVIDSSGVANRIMEWMTWKYDIGGELYFSLNAVFDDGDRVWNDVYAYGGNGDGTLMYPGRPKDVGGTTHIPIESIRLKLIREGLEDYEYLSLLRTIDSSSAQAIVDRLIINAYTYERDPEKLYESRREIAQKLMR